MTIDITALDVLPETEPITGLAELGLGLCGAGSTCWWTCGVSCKGATNS